MVWDEGFYEALGHEKEPVKSQEKVLLQELEKGDLKIVLHGEKVKGAYALVKIKGRGENAWLLIKKQDDEVSKSDITKKDRSVKTNRNLRQIAEEGGGKVKEKKSLVKKTPKAQLLSNKDPKKVKKKSPT
jgi:bifunctional non-homologous end joining protein LigD